MRPRCDKCLIGLPISSLALLLLMAVAPEMASAQITLQVPEEPPDSIPGDILDDIDPEYGVPSDVLIVAFFPGLTVERKGELLAAVGCIGVIGGAPVADQIFDGIYIVRIETGGDMLALLAAGDALLEHEGEVILAAMYTQLSPGGPPT